MRGPYALAVAGESFHWMDWTVVPGKLAASLRHDAVLALVTRPQPQVPWADGLAELIPRYSTNRAFRPYDLVSELTTRGVFEETGRHRTRPVCLAQSVDDYIESFHSRNGFSRDRMKTADAADFDRALRQLLSGHCPNGVVEAEATASLVWGRPIGLPTL
jgi:hypothetical protein